MNRRHVTNPQHLLPGIDVFAFGTASRWYAEQPSKPAPGEAPTSA